MHLVGDAAGLVDRPGPVLVAAVLLVSITARKAAHLVRDAGRQKRGGSTAPPAGSST